MRARRSHRERQPPEIRGAKGPATSSQSSKQPSGFASASMSIMLLRAGFTLPHRVPAALPDAPTGRWRIRPDRWRQVLAQLEHRKPDPAFGGPQRNSLALSNLGMGQAADEGEFQGPPLIGSKARDRLVQSISAHAEPHLVVDVVRR